MPGRITAVYQYSDPRVNDEYYSSDEFRMFGFKIIPCPRTRSHDWTDCPLAHRGERATRRDPNAYNYMAIACPYYKANNGECPIGETCCFAHGIFEYWLHPAKYRTRPCQMARRCRRKVCFFAHDRNQIRTEIKYKVQWSNDKKNFLNVCNAPVVKAFVAAPDGSNGSAFDAMSWEEMRRSIWAEVIGGGGCGVDEIETEQIEEKMRDLKLVDTKVAKVYDEVDWVSQLVGDNLSW